MGLYVRCPKPGSFLYFLSMILHFYVFTPSFCKRMTMDEMIAKGIATKEGERADGKNINIIVNGDVERIDGHVNLLGVKGNVRRINTSHGDITVNGDVDGDVHTNYGDISCGNIDGDARTNFGNIYRK